MGQRNWCSVKYKESTGELIFDIRVETEKGCGQTHGYFTLDILFNGETDLYI